jgi:hypothetical protein
MTTQAVLGFSGPAAVSRKLTRTEVVVTIVAAAPALMAESALLAGP